MASIKIITDKVKDPTSSGLFSKDTSSSKDKNEYMTNTGFTNPVTTVTAPTTSVSNSYGGYPSYIPPGLDLSAFDNLINSAYSSADSSRLSLQDSYNQALKTLSDAKNSNNQAFGQGRASISENSYDRSMSNQNDLAARGLAGSGLEQLGDVQEAMAKGNEVSTLANDYYAAQNEIANEEVNATNQLNATQREIDSALQQNIASIEMAKWQEQNAYNQMLADAAYQDAVNSYSINQEAINLDNASSEQYRVNLSNGLAYLQQGYSPEIAANLSGADIGELTGYAKTLQEQSDQESKNNALASIYSAYSGGDEEGAQALARMYNYSYPNAAITQDDLNVIGISAPNNSSFPAITTEAINKLPNYGGLYWGGIKEANDLLSNNNNNLSDFYKNYGIK